MTVWGRTIGRGIHRYRAIGAVLLAAACVGSNERASPDEGSGDLGTTTLTMLASANFRIMSPYWSMSFDHMVFLTLFDIDEHGRIRGRLARAWEMQPDGRTFTYHLRTDVRWHDGVPVTAHDVKFTYDLLTHPDVLYWSADAQTVRVLDDSTFTIAFNNADSWPEPLEWWAVYYPKHLLEDLDPADIREWEFWERPVGNGPFRFVRSNGRDMMELEANPDHFAGRPAIDRVILRFGFGNATATTLEMMAGNADVTAPSPSLRDSYQLAARDPRFEFYWTHGESYWWLFWNLEHPILGDRAVRRALSLAIDPKVIAAAMEYPPEAPLYVRTDPYVEQSGEETVFAPMSRDLEAARRLLDEAGWRDEDGDGIRERDGRPLRFDVLTGGGTSIMVAIQAQLKDVGARAEIVTVDGGVITGRIAERDYEAFLAPGKLDQPGGGDMVEYLVRPSVHPGRHSLATLRSPRLKELAARLDTTVAPAARARLLSEIWDTWLQELPATPVLPDVLGTLAHRRVRGLSSPFRAWPTSFIDELWIDPDWKAEQEGADRNADGSVPKETP